MMSKGGGSGVAKNPGRIRPPRRIIRQPVGANSEEDPAWEILKSALTDIHNKDCSKLSFEQLYRASYKIVLNKKGSALYEDVKAFEEKWFADNVIPEIKGLVTKNLISIALSEGPGTSVAQRRQAGEQFLRGIRDTWENHKMCMNMTADVLMYLERNWVTDTKRPSIFLATVGLFRDYILKSTLGMDSATTTVFNVLNSVVIDQITMERQGDVIDKNLIRTNMYMLEALYETNSDEKEEQKLYLTTFEPAFIRQSEVFYRDECEKLLRDGDAGTWLVQTRNRLVEEQERCGTTLSELTRNKITEVIDKNMVASHISDFMALESTGLKSMIDNDKEELLEILYVLVSRVDPEKTVLVNTVKLRIVEMGLEIEKQVLGTLADQPGATAADKSAQQTAAAIKWVDDVLCLKVKFDRLWENCFNKDLLIQTAISKAFSEFIERFPRASEFVSLYVDDNLKKGIRGKTETEVDQILANAITVIQYLSDKDMFERYYQKHLARRLLWGKSESHDVEKEMIARMKQELGNQFTSKFEGMFKDLITSEDLSNGYREYKVQSQDEDTAIDLSINILTSNCWPKEIEGQSAKSKCIYPPEIQKLQASILAFYLRTRNGRKLQWVDSSGNADIICRFPAVPGKGASLAKPRKYEINVSTYGMIVLLLFNEVSDEALTFEEVQQRTGIPARELPKTLGILSIPPKSRVLIKEPMSKSVQPGDKFRFNKEFSSKLHKIKTATSSTVSKVEDATERKDTEDATARTRAYVIDAAVVRIMKQRKTLGHSQLISEVISQLASRFRPEVVLVKKRIEDLIAREYLERVEEASAPTYRYLS